MTNENKCANCGMMFPAQDKTGGERPLCPLCAGRNPGDTDATFVADKNKTYVSDSVNLRKKDSGSRADDTDGTFITGSRPQGTARPGAIGKTLFGQYEISEEIGRGGMGVVYKARQQKLNRLVAIKVLIAGEDASEDLIKRFEREAMSSAKLKHPNIISVYDVGDEGGRFYYSMEYIEGRPLNNAISDGVLKNRQLIEIMAKIARAIDYAHGEGIIHRDLKPANVIIQKNGEPKVMDFGLARDSGAATQLTQAGMTMGTPSYMPPEQALGELEKIDARSDVYSLGAILYEMLTGSPPFTGNTAATIINKVIHDDPLAPSKLNSNVHRDLQTICLKCLEKEPARRYSTAGEFAEDIERFLNGEPILAVPSTVFTVIARRLKKNRRSATVVAAIGIAALVVSLYFLHLQNIEAEKADIAEQKATAAETQRQRFFEARTLLQKMQGALVDAERVWRLGKRELMMNKTAQLINEIETVTKQYPEYPDAWYEKAKLLMMRYEYDKADEAFTRCIELEPNHSEAHWERGLIRSKNYFDAVLDISNKVNTGSIKDINLENPELAGLQKRALDDFESIEGSLHKDKFDCGKGIVASYRGDADKALSILQDVSARTQNSMDIAECNIAIILVNKSEFDDALKHMDFAIQSHQGKDIYYVQRGLIYNEIGKFEKAIEEYGKAIELNPNNEQAYRHRAVSKVRMNKFLSAVKDFDICIKLNPNNYTTYQSRGWTYALAGDFEKAKADYETACRMNPKSAYNFLNRGAVYQLAKEYGKAIEYLTRAQELDPKEPDIYLARGRTYRALGEYEKAISDIERASELNPSYAQVHIELGQVYHTTAKYEKAIEEYSKAIEMKKGSAAVYLDRGRAYLQIRQLDNAEADFVKILEMDENSAAAYFHLGEVYKFKKQFEKALEYYEKAIDLGDTSIEALRGQANAYALLGKPKRALNHFKIAIEKYPDSYQLYFDRSVIYCNMGDFDSAMEDINKSISLKQDYHMPYFHRGIIFADRKEYDKAIENYDMAIKLKPDYEKAIADRALAYYYKKDYPRALEDCNTALKIDAGDALAFNTRGITYLALKEYDKALEAFNSAIMLDRKFALAYANRGMLYYEKNDYERASRDADSAASLGNKSMFNYLKKQGVYKEKNEEEDYE